MASAIATAPFKVVEVEIKGLTPLLQNRFGETAEVDIVAKTRRVAKDYGTPREQAEQVAYRNKEGLIWHPGAAIAAGLREAGSSHKQKGSRKALKWIVPAAVLILDEQMVIRDLDGKPKKDFEVDTRRVVIRATGNGVLRCRPRHDEWLIRFTLRVNENVIDADTIHMLLTEMGQQLGLGDYRPQRGGSFGLFSVTSWKAK